LCVFRQNDGEEILHFSIASLQNPEFILVAKNLGVFTSKMKNIKLGTKVMVEGPYGYFSHLNTKNKKQVWLAGGIGVTPFLGMAEKMRNDGGYEVDLYYCTKNSTEAVLLEELQSITETNKSFRVIPWYSDERGHLNAYKISEMTDGLMNRDVFICGPISFSNDITRQLKGMGFPKLNIHSERFKFN
jgi:predicted ferric reductase